MVFMRTLARTARSLRLTLLGSERPSSGLVAAVVGIDSSHEGGDWMSAEHEQKILAGLIRAIDANGCGKFDGAERNSTQVIWYFFGSDARALEDTLLPALRSEPRCSGGLLRLTSNGVVGPWREIRI